MSGKQRIKELRRALHRADIEVERLQEVADTVGATRDDNVLAQAKRKRDAITREIERYDTA